MIEAVPTAPNVIESIHALAAQIEICLAEADALEMGLVGIHLNDALEAVKAVLP